MSPQSRAPFSEITTSCPNGLPGNVCPLNLSSSWDDAEVSSSSVHKITDMSSVNAGCPSGVLGKRGSDLITSNGSSASSQPFLSSYGSAFLSGIFADIAEVNQGDDAESDDSDRLRKKSRLSIVSRKKSCRGLNTMGGEAVLTLPSSSIISPRSHKSTIKIELFNDQDHQLQNLAFPTLPGLPAAVSSSSCTTATTGVVVTPRDTEMEQDQESFGWFVATDDDGASADEATSPPSFLPVPKPDLAFQATEATAPSAEDDTEVQQALAADTIDDVLGDLF
jgi:hypothetical protein